MDANAICKPLRSIWRVHVGEQRKETPRQSNRRNDGMLVLSRKKNESIVINNDITIVVVEIRGDKVRLGVEAPKEVPVHRREVYDAIRRNELNEGNAAPEPDRSQTAEEA